MCMCCDVPIYVNYFLGKFDLKKSTYYMFIASCIMTVFQAILTVAAVAGQLTEDFLTDIILYLGITAFVYSTIWSYVVYKKPTADLLLVAEYAFLMVPLPLVSVAGYTLLDVEEIFFPINCVLEIIMSGFNFYFAIVIHSLYIEQFFQEQEAETDE